MRFAYADPPYLGSAKRYAANHPDAAAWDNVATHKALIDMLCADYPDGWALSMGAKSLPVLLPLCPPTVRVCAWVKPFSAFKHVRVAYGWEPVVVCGGRAPSDPDAPATRDWLAENMTLQRGLVGAKPARFNRWVLDLLGYIDGTDTLDDLFPGTGGMAHALATPPLLHVTGAVMR